MSTLKLSSETISLRTKCARQLRSLTYQQIRHATLIRRPKRPYTFTQLVKLSDGSSFLQRTTSPEAVYTSTKDARNTIMWNPSSQRLLSIEEDEAGKLSRFRERFGRGWDAKTTKSDTKVGKVISIGALAFSQLISNLKLGY